MSHNGSMVLYIETPRKRDNQGLPVDPVIYLKGNIHTRLMHARKWERETGERCEKIHGKIVGSKVIGRQSELRIIPYGVKMRGEECIITGEETDVLPAIYVTVKNDGIVL